jgi:hypothetical protein
VSLRMGGIANWGIEPGLKRRMNKLVIGHTKRGDDDVKQSNRDCDDEF